LIGLLIKLTFNRVKEKAKELCQGVSYLINKGEFGKDFSLRDQIWRAAGSIMDNTCPVK